MSRTFGRRATSASTALTTSSAGGFGNAGSSSRLKCGLVAREDVAVRRGLVAREDMTVRIGNCNAAAPMGLMNSSISSHMVCLV